MNLEKNVLLASVFLFLFFSYQMPEIEIIWFYEFQTSNFSDCLDEKNHSDYPAGRKFYRVVQGSEKLKEI